MRGGPRIHLLLIKVQAFTGKGRLTAAAANHVQIGSLETPSLHRQPDRRAAELEAKVMEEGFFG